MPKLQLYLSDQEHKALVILSQNEMRDPRAQALLIVKRELERCGLLPEKPAAEVKPEGVINGR